VIYAFAGCELDTERFEVRRGGKRQPVEPQVFDVLVHLVRNRDRLVTREELLARVWGHSYVSDATVSSRLMAARKAIGDDGTAQSLIRTVRGRGYRCVGRVAEAPEAPTAAGLPTSPAALPIGRERERAELHRLLEAALAGQRQLVVVTGEAGIGKTTLVEGFVAEASQRTAPLVASGRCVEPQGPLEPYMPLLEALGRLARLRR